MKNVIHKYVLLNGCNLAKDYDQAFNADGVCEVRLTVPFDAQLLAVDVDPTDHRVCQDIACWYVVDLDPDRPFESRRFFLVYSGGVWPERTHRATLFPVDGARVVHVFGGGIE